jgi:hypothetical protein
MHKIKYHSIIIMVLSALTCFSQVNVSTKRARYLKIQSGFIWDINNSFGPRVGFELMKSFKNKERLFSGVGIESKWHLIEAATDLYEPPDLNTINITYSIHYIQPFAKDKLFWDASAGMGAIYLFGEGKSSLQPSLSLGLSLNFKLSKSIVFETAPLLIIPPISKVIFSPNRLYEEKQTYTQFTFVPIGLTIKLNNK